MLQQKFNPNKELLKLKDIEINIQGLNKEQAQEKLEFVSNTPQVYYYDLELPANAIKKLVINSSKFLPIFHLQFIDIYNIMHDVGFPTDNAVIKIVLPSNNPALANIFMEFKIENYNVELMRDLSTKKITMWGICNIENMLVSDYKSYKDTSTYNLMQNIARESGLGFISNVGSSSDKMTWINPGINNYSFLQDTINKSWVGENGYVWGFVDLYYNLNYIDVEQQYNQKLDEIQWVSTHIMTDNKVDDNTKTVPPILTNSIMTTASNMNFSGEKILNQSTDVSLKRGYIRNIHYYDIDGNWTDKGGAYKIYALDTITTPGSENTSIYLKGEPGNLDFYNKNQTNHYLDKLDTINMHPDFLWAKVQNEENLYDLQKISIQITLAIPNYNIKRFEKIKLIFSYDNDNISGNVINKTLHGEWMVTGIQYEWNGDAIYQFVTLVKRELSEIDL